MKRIFAWALVVGISLLIFGCEAWTKKSPPADQGDKAAISEVKPEPDAKAEAAAPTEEPAPEAAPAGGQTHVVAKGETLYILARKYYNGNQSMWRKIWEANKAQVPNPNQLKVGQQLIIP